MPASKKISQLALSLEIVLLRIQSGQCLSQALRQLPSFSMPRGLCENWLNLRQQMEEGRISCELGLKSYIDQLRLEEELLAKLHEKTLLPKLQLYLIIAGALAFGSSTQFFYPPHLQPQPSQCAWSLVLLATAALWMHWELRRFASQLWYCEWIFFLSRLRAQLVWGQTLSSSFAKSYSKKELGRLPSSLKDSLIQFATHLHQGQIDRFATESGRKNFQAFSEEWKVQEELCAMADLEAQGQGLAVYIEKTISLSHSTFERKLSLQTQILSLRLLAPLFLFCVPSFLLIIFAPLLNALKAL